MTRLLPMLHRWSCTGPERDTPGLEDNYAFRSAAGDDENHQTETATQLNEWPLFTTKRRAWDSRPRLFAMFCLRKDLRLSRVVAMIFASLIGTCQSRLLLVAEVVNLDKSWTRFAPAFCSSDRSPGNPFPWWASLPLAIADDDDERNRRSPRRSQYRKKGARGRDEVAAERQALWERTQAEIDAIASHYHGLLPRGVATAIGAIYGRYSTQLQDSIADQVRSLFEAAVKKGIFVPREHVYVDLAVRGYRDDRPGLNGLRNALATRSMQVLLVFTTNRLFRKQYKVLKFIEEEIVEARATLRVRKKRPRYRGRRPLAPSVPDSCRNR